jgi:glucosylceramidase
VNSRHGPHPSHLVREFQTLSCTLATARRIVAAVAAVAFLSGCPSSNENAPPPSTLPTVQVFETTGDRSKLLQEQASTKFVSGSAIPGPAIILDSAKRYQVIDGFGASFTDSSAWLVWNKLSTTQRTSLMEQFFSRMKGIGLSFLRQPMGATDFSASGDYSYDDMAPGQTDPNLNNFSVAHDNAYIIPLVQQALAINPDLKVVALPWSPPAWMKTTGTMNGGNIDPQFYSSLSQYFVKFVQAYRQAGIPIYALSVQNEPLYSTNAYATAYVSPNDEAHFIADFLSPALAQSSMADVKIFGYEHNWDNTSYPTSLLGSSASANIAGISFHCYAGDPTAQTTVKNDAPTKDIWFTECSGITSTTFANDLVWNAGHLLIGATRNWARSISLWNLALDQNSGPRNGSCTNCRGVVTIDDSVSPANISLNVEYYILGHISKFVHPGARRIDSNTFGPGNIEDVAFQNPDGSTVLLVLNSAAVRNSFSVRFNGNAFSYSLPPDALATFVWK